MNRPFPREGLNRAAAMTGILLFFAATSLAQTKLDSEIGPADPAAVQVAVEKGLFFVEHQSMRWWKTKKCATCHEGQILLVAANIAKSQGISVDQEKLDFWTERWVIVDALAEEKDGVFNGLGMDTAPFVLSHRDFDRDASATRAELWTKVLRMAFKQDDAKWDRPQTDPSSTTPRVALALAALEESKLAFPPDLRREITERRQRTDEWIKSHDVQRPEKTEYLAGWLTYEHQRGEPERARQLLDELLSRRGEDGGWGIKKGDPSHLLVTSVVLLALKTSGLPNDNPVVGGTQRYLLSKQSEDGRWHELGRHFHPEAYHSAYDAWTTGYAVAALSLTMPKLPPGAKRLSIPDPKLVADVEQLTRSAADGYVGQRDRTGDPTKPDSSKSPSNAPADAASPEKEKKALEVRLTKHIEVLGGRIVRELKDPDGSLVEIDLSETKVTDDDLRLVSQLAELRTLNLHRTGISDAGIEHLVGLQHLTTLTLGDTRITNAGLKTLTKLEQLQFIGLHGTLIDDAGVKHLQAFPHLKSLFLSKSRVTDEGLKSVKSLVDLELLWLAESHITDVGLAELETLSGLKSLSLEKTTITDKGLVHLAGIKELVYLDVRGTKVTASGLSRLTSQNKVEHLAHDFPRIVPGVTIAVGERVPELSAIDLHGQSWKFAQLHRLAKLEKPVPLVLTFWCSFCPSCRQVERDLDALAKKYAGKAMVVALDASAGETGEMCRKVADEKGLTLPILLEGGGQTADVFGTETTTTTVVIDAGGVLRYCGQFARNKERCAEVALEAILNGKPVAVPTTPHLGCPIVRTYATSAHERFADAYADAIQTLLQDKFAESNSGMVIGLLDEHSSRVFSAGKLDNGSDQKVDGDTVFELGSVTKVFTALLLLDAVRRGEMKLDDPLSKYLPAQVKVSAHDGKEIKLLNLAVQDSGLPFFPDNLWDKPLKELTLKEKKEGSDAYTVEKMYAFVSGHKLTQDPGASFEYSNVGMALLGHAIERKTGADYESLVVDRICRPLKLDSTRITLPPALKTSLARGHLDDGAPSEHFHLQAMAPAGSLLSTANDLLKFLSANLGFTQTDLTPLMADMQVNRHTGSPSFGRTAMPWFDSGVYNPPGTELLGHAGGGYGNVAFVAFDKKKRRGVVVLTNQMKVHPGGIGWTILQGLPLTRENITFLVREVVGLGIGLDTDQKTGLPRIMTVYPKSPAGEAGLSVGLVIQKINGTSVEGKSLKECLGMMGGPVETKVRLELFDPAKKEAKTVELARQKFLTATGDSRK